MMYYLVEAKCRLLTGQPYILLLFSVKATDADSAAEIVRQSPRVYRGDNKDPIISVRTATLAEYQTYWKELKRDVMG